MLTAKEIPSHEFEIVKRGYDIEEVKAYLRQVASQFDALNNEKNDIEQKMLVLADKIEDYRSEEDSIRSALLNAQKLGDSIVQEAKQKADIAFHEAELRAQYIIDSAADKVEREKVNLYTMQNEVAKFKNNVLSIYKSHLEVLSLIPDSTNMTDDDEDNEQPDGFVAPVEEAVPASEPEYAPAAVAPELPAEDDDIPVVEPISDMDDFYSDFRQDNSVNDVSDIDDNNSDSDEKTSRFGKLDFGDSFSFKL